MVRVYIVHIPIKVVNNHNRLSHQLLLLLTIGLAAMYILCPTISNPPFSSGN
jgi:hypothetical protein